jgi:hypothetical protein
LISADGHHPWIYGNSAKSITGVFRAQEAAPQARYQICLRVI